MYCWTDVTEVPAGFGPSVVTIGNFDGVHRGHVSVLESMVADARAAGVRAVAVTFSPHPSQVHRPESAPPLLVGDVDRLELLAATGLDAVLLLDYTLELAANTPEEFVTRYLVDGLSVRTVVVGRDVRFGRANSGDLDTMRALGRTYGFTVEVVEDVAPPAQGDAPRAAHRRWSSTWARELLDAGDVAAAAEILGRPHRMRGIVVHGDARGRELGFPTANLAQDSSGMPPADGVYAGWLRPLTTPGDPASTAAEVLPAAISIGSNPTFAGRQRRVEAYALDRTDLELYGQEIVIEFVDHVRATTRFDSVAELVTQMHDDVARVRAALDSASGVRGERRRPELGA